jgi:hypothetical protein
MRVCISASGYSGILFNDDKIERLDSGQRAIRPKLACGETSQLILDWENPSGGKSRCQEKKAGMSPVCGFSDDDTPSPVTFSIARVS